MVPRKHDHRWPVFLRDGKHFLYLAANHDQYDHPDTALYIASLDGKENRLLLRAPTNAAVVGDELLFLRESAPHGAAFRRQTTDR